MRTRRALIYTSGKTLYSREKKSWKWKQIILSFLSVSPIQWIERENSLVLF